MASNAEKAEIDRLVTQVQKLGTEGLKRAATCLREAIQEIEKPVPDAVLTGFPIPNTSHMRWETVRSVQEPGIGRRATVEDADPTIQEHLASDGEELPFFVQYDHVQVRYICLHDFHSSYLYNESTLATVSMVLTLNRVPDHLRG